MAEINIESENETQSSSYVVNYAKNILCQLKEFRRNEQFCDVILISGVDGERINVHRSILSAASEYFASLFADSTNDKVTLNEIDGNILKIFVDFFYSGQIEIEKVNVKKLLIASQMFQISEVTNFCIEFFTKQINSINFMEILLLAQNLNSEKLMENVEAFMRQNFKQISKTKEFLQLTSAQLCRLIASDKLNVTSEEEVFHAMMSWLNFDVENRKIYVAGLLAVIRMSQLSTEFINKNVRSVCEANGCQELVMETLFNRLVLNEPTKSKENLLKPRISTKNETSLQPKVLQENETLLAVGCKFIVHKGEFHILWYSNETNKWSLWKKFSHDKEIAGCCLWNQKLYLHFGYYLICLNIQTGKREAFKSFQKKRSWANLVVFEKHLYALGGKSDWKFCKTVEKYNPKSDEWINVAEMNIERTAFGTAVLNGLLFVAGGFNTEFLNETECYNPNTNSWTKMCPMKECRSEFGLVTDNRFLYAIGGYTFTYSKTVEIYDPQLNKWTLMANSLSNSRYSYGCNFYKGQIYVAGGQNYKYFDTVEIYDPKTENWTFGAPLTDEYKKVFLFKTLQNNFIPKNSLGISPIFVPCAFVFIFLFLSIAIIFKYFYVKFTTIPNDDIMTKAFKLMKGFFTQQSSPFNFFDLFL